MKSMAQRAHEEMLQAKQQLQQMQQSAAERLEQLTKQALHQEQHKVTCLAMNVFTSINIVRLNNNY